MGIRSDVQEKNTGGFEALTPAFPISSGAFLMFQYLKESKVHERHTSFLSPRPASNVTKLKGGKLWQH
jgi:hypothetical protein